MQNPWSLFLQAFKSCFGSGFEADIPPKSGYKEVGKPATGFEKEQVYGIQAEYLDEDDMAWGEPKRPKKRAQQ